MRSSGSVKLYLMMRMTVFLDDDNCNNDDDENSDDKPNKNHPVCERSAKLGI